MIKARETRTDRKGERKKKNEHFIPRKFISDSNRAYGYFWI